MMEAFWIILFFIGLMLILYFKLEPNLVVKFPLIITVWSFSVIINISLFDYELIGTPYIQIFFVVIQTIILFITAMEYRELKRLKE